MINIGGDVEDVNGLLFVAVVLDPKYKIQYVKYCFSCMYDVELAAKLTLMVETILQRLFAFYSGGKKISDTNEGNRKGSKPEIVEKTPTNRRYLSQYLKLQ